MKAAFLLALASFASAKEACDSDETAMMQGQMAIRKHAADATANDEEQDEDFDEASLEEFDEASVGAFALTSTGLPGAAQYIGCFTDNRGRDMGRWLGDRNNAATNTFAGCAAACNKAFMSLQSGGECFCSDTYGNAGYTERPDSECGPVAHINANCASNSHSCGGHWRNAVYRNYHTTEGGAGTCDSGTPLVDTACNTAVTQLATDAGRTPGRGLQRGSGGGCRDGGWGQVPTGCSAQSGGDWAAHFKTGPSGTDANCAHPAYQLVCTGQAPYVGADHFVGCFTDNRARDMGRWLGDRNNAATNTFASCAAACNKAFFSLQSGGECFCSDTYANAGYSARPDSECGPVPHINANCASNSHSCGGHWRNAVYRNYHMTEGGARTCDSGTPLADNVCNAAVTQLASAVSQTPRRGLQRGSGGGCRDGGWGQVPTGCSAQSGGDWAAHFKTGPTGTDANCVHEAYQLVCTGV